MAYLPYYSSPGSGADTVLNEDHTVSNGRKLSKLIAVISYRVDQKSWRVR